jgi:hypothetical protein
LYSMAAQSDGLGRTLSLELNCCFLGQPSVAFPRHFGGYPKLPGVPGLMNPNPLSTRKVRILPVIVATLVIPHQRSGYLSTRVRSVYKRALTCQSDAFIRAWYSASEMERLEYRHAVTNMFLS